MTKRGKRRSKLQAVRKAKIKQRQVVSRRRTREEEAITRVEERRRIIIIKRSNISLIRAKKQWVMRGENERTLSPAKGGELCEAACRKARDVYKFSD